MGPQQHRRRRSFRAAGALIGYAGVVTVVVLTADTTRRTFGWGGRAFRGLSTAPSSGGNVGPYTRHDVLYTQRNYTKGRRNAVMVFDGKDDAFKTYVQLTDDGKDENDVRRDPANRLLARALRVNFPERFGPGKPSFQVLYSTQDLPRTDCLKTPRKCKAEAFAPVLHFGSVPRDPSILPTTRAMPLPTLAGCMLRMPTGKDGDAGSCDLFGIPQDAPAWDDLVPQIVWRGRNFWFLPTLGYKKWKRGGHFYHDVNPRKLTREQVADGLLDRHFEDLTPRWRGVALSLRAKLDAERDGTTPPWIDAQFSLRAGLHDQETEEMRSYVKTGNPVGTERYMDEDELVRYKYHVDFGGGGGTTWDGTIRKLAMPGLLFHHETITKDWFHDELKPWVHYVPIKMDVSDLRERFEWAESHPEEARKIARAGQDFVRTRMKEFMKESYESLFVDYLGEVVAAYRPGEGEGVESILDDYRAEGIEMELASSYSHDFDSWEVLCGQKHFALTRACQLLTY